MMAIFIVMGSQADLPRWPDETGGGIILQGHGNHDVIWAIQFGTTLNNFQFWILAPVWFPTVIR